MILFAFHGCTSFNKTFFLFYTCVKKTIGYLELSFILVVSKIAVGEIGSLEEGRDGVGV